MGGGADEMAGGLTYDEVMGIVRNNQTPLEKDANQIWQKLDHLAATDAKAYRKFIDETMKEGADYYKQVKEGGGEVPLPKPAMPTPRFWVETVLLDSEGRSTGIPRYFNMCESETMEFTDEKNFNIYMSDLDNRQIDCVIHPFFMRKILDDNLFLHDAVQLVFETYEAEHKEKEKVKRQYQHHPEPRKLRMKPPKVKPPPKAAKKDESVMDVLGGVRHSDAAKKMMHDEERERRKHLFDLHGPPKPKPKPAEQPKPAPRIEEVLPSLEHELTSEQSGCTVMVALPATVQIGDVEVEVETQGAGSTLIVTIPGKNRLTLPLPCRAREHSAKYLRKKQKLKICITA
eukprot:TRINITY_DN47430_c0_g1_i1.p1 TRINITY_DN47430_c0_g1~~TRINITY_DN47430_c0_g1_i1.p1  ORF type:complete len:363 (+),score=150.48 TRINITY_DN47430_c0_g1_i1:59-1090(+)